MRVGILQPGFVPWLGYFDLLDWCDVFVILDHVQFTDRDWRTRNKILTGTGPQWINVPVRKQYPEGVSTRLPIDRIEIAVDARWRDKHLELLRHAYGRAPYYDWLFPQWKSVITDTTMPLVDFLQQTTHILSNALGLNKKVISSRSLNISSNKAQLIIDLCVALGATEYLSGPAAMDYLDATAFENLGIDLQFQNYQCMPYQQMHDAPFISHLSVLDLLFMSGPDAVHVLREGHQVQRIQKIAS